MEQERFVITTGKTVEEATEAACAELGRSREQVRVEILAMPEKKLFKTTPAKVKVTVDGEFMPSLEVESEPVPPQPKPETHQAVPAEKPAAPAAPPARPTKTGRAALHPDSEEPVNPAEVPNLPIAIAYLTSVFAALGLPEVQVVALRQGDAVLLRVDDERIQNVMDTRGETVQALSYLTDRAANKGVDKRDPAYIRLRLDVAGYRNRREAELVQLARRVGGEVSKTHRSRTLAPMNPYERLIVHTAISEMEGLVSESIGTDNERRVVIKSTAADATDGPDWVASTRNTRPGGRGDNRNRRGGGHGQGGSGQRNPGGRGPAARGRGPREDRGGQPRTNTPEREFADAPRDPDAKPVVPERRDTIKDGEDLPLYGKIEL